MAQPNFAAVANHPKRSRLGSQHARTGWSRCLAATNASDPATNAATNASEPLASDGSSWTVAE